MDCQNYLAFVIEGRRNASLGAQPRQRRLIYFSLTNSVVGTKRTKRAGLTMSVVRGISEVPFQGRLDPILTQLGHR